jgi:hypothetical protein
MKDVSRALLLAPPIFVVHFLEEAPGFVEWFNSHVARGITPSLFWAVNLTALFITLAVVAFEWFSRTPLSLGVALAWLCFLMLANVALHVAGALVDGRYVPGLVTAALLYLPYCLWLFVRALKSRRITPAALLAAAVPCSLPMLIHAYLILFRGDRLF